MERTRTARARRRPAPEFDKLLLPDGRALLSETENKETPRLFVAATRQNEGKTTTCLGLFGALKTRFNHVAYIKPLGQRCVDIDGILIDEDSYLLDSIYKVDVPIEATSPIAIAPDFTRRFLNNPENLRPLIVDRVCRAFDRTAYGKELVIIEGSGHAGVGSVFDMSNAQVARTLNAKAVIVSSGGIGHPVDEIALNLALFQRFGVEVIGAILNRVLADKADIVREYASRGLARLGVPLLGVIPIEPQLAAPNLNQVADELKGRWLHDGHNYGPIRILDIIVDAPTPRSLIDSCAKGTLVITQGDRDDIILASLARQESTGENGIVGIVLTGNVPPHPRLARLLERARIPVILSKDSSYTVASRLHSMTVKTQPEDADKIPLIRKLVLEHIDLQRLHEALA